MASLLLLEGQQIIVNFARLRGILRFLGLDY